MKNKYFCWLFLLFALISAGANAQVKVEGSVFDEMDNPLIGVSVFTENRKAGTVTDVDGHFSITVPNTKGNLNLFLCGLYYPKSDFERSKTFEGGFERRLRSCWTR
jgi:hypothetical protein